MIVSVPLASAVVEYFATPALNVALPSVVLPLLKVTVPVGVPPYLPFSVVGVNPEIPLPQFQRHGFNQPEIPLARQSLV